MKALTVWQPWASLIAIGAKPYEFRSWKPPRRLIGQRIAIHAGARRPSAREVGALIDRCNAGDLGVCLKIDVALPLLERAFANEPVLTLSHVLCTAVLGEAKRGYDCAREFGAEIPEEAAGREGAQIFNDSDREGTFNYGWPLTAIEILKPPIPRRGMQGFWECSL